MFCNPANGMVNTEKQLAYKTRLHSLEWNESLSSVGKNGQKNLRWPFLKFVSPIPERSVPLQQQDREDRTLEGSSSAPNVVPAKEPNHEDRKPFSPKKTSKTLSVEQQNQRCRRSPRIDSVARLGK